MSIIFEHYKQLKEIENEIMGKIRYRGKIIYNIFTILSLRSLMGGQLALSMVVSISYLPSG